MGTDNLFWKRKNKSLKRKSGNRGEPLPSFLIVCEGGKIEPNYFKSFKLSSARVKVEGTGMNTVSLVGKTIEIIQKTKTDEETYDQVWCVFDKDDFSLQSFNGAIEMAEKNGIKIAYSNEAFELWYLLHFHYFDTGISREDYKLKLSKLLGFPYLKNEPGMYRELLSQQDKAIKNAKKLLSTYDPCRPGEDNPSTTVHRLVIELNKYLHR
jgi:hypothetical protein